MFARKVQVEHVPLNGQTLPCPVAWIDNFAMRSFTNDAVFDDTLPVSDGLLEIGARVPLPLLQERMSEWFRRKGYLAAGDTLVLREMDRAPESPV